MTIAISASGIALDGPLVAGEKVAVTVSGLALAAEDKPTLALLARFPAALLASVELAESETAGTWTGELDTATKQTALFFATARADERRDAALELVSGRASLARLTVPMANSALCPKPDGSPFASPVYVPVPGPPGTGGDPYDQAPEMDGEASAGVSDEYARGDHRHPTDTTRQAVIADLDAIRSGAAAGTTAVQPAALAAVATTGDYADLTNKPTIPAAQIQSDWNQTNSAAVDYIKNKPTIPGPAPVTSVNGETGDVAIYGNTLVMGQGQSTLVSAAIADAQSDATRALNELDYTASAISIAPAFSTSSTYAVGDYCTHEGLLYKCTTAVSTAGAWDAANWTAVAVTDEMGADAPRNVWYVGSTIGTGGTISGSTTTGDFVLAEGNVVVVKMSFGVNATSATLNIDGTGAKSISTRSGTTTFPKYFWSNGQAIAFVYDGTYYIPCGMAPATIYNTWGLTSLSSTVSNDETKAATPKAVNTRAPKDSPAFTGMPTAPTAPAGTNTTQVATTAFVQQEARYALTAKTPTVSGTSATVACEDRAINDFTVATGITSLTITPPAAVTGRARDFFCRVSLTDSSLPTVTLSGATIDIGASEVAGMTQGVNLLMFTEIASGHWLASRRSAS